MVECFYAMIRQAENAGRKPDYWEIPRGWYAAIDAYNKSLGQKEKAKTLVGIPFREISNARPLRLVLKPKSTDDYIYGD